MSQTEVISRLQGIFGDVFLEPPSLSAELSAEDVEEWDSLTQISLLVAVERSFGIKFRVGEVEGTRNVGEFADLIARRAQER